jgi:hypothetical protein
MSEQIVFHQLPIVEMLLTILPFDPQIMQFFKLICRQLFVFEQRFLP